MSEQEQLVSRSEAELFGSEGYFVEPSGPERFYRVASDLGTVVDRLKGTDFELRSANLDFYLIFRQNKLVFALHRFYGQNEGLWILDRQLEEYSTLDRVA